MMRVFADSRRVHLWWCSGVRSFYCADLKARGISETGLNRFLHTSDVPDALL